MNPTSDLLIGLALILLCAQLSAQLAARFALPSVFGVLLSGVILGPSATGLVTLSPELQGISTVGVVILLFVAGVETDLIEMRRVGAAAMLAAIGGVALPMGLAFLLARQFGYDIAESVFLGTIMTATSVTVSAHVLRELGYLQTKVGSAILGAAIIDDVIGVIVLTIVVSMEGGGSVFDLVRLGVFIPVALVAGAWLINMSARRLLHFEAPERRYVEVLALVLGFSWAAQAIGGLAAISGAYLAGALFGRTVFRDDLASFGNTIGFALFAPVFFVTTGMMADLHALARTPVFTLLLLLTAVVGKIVGSGLGALAGRFRARESLAVGAGMVSRGEVAIVIAVLGKNSGVIGDDTFTASIVVTLLTTLAAPLLLRLTLPGVARLSDEAPAEAAHRLYLEEQIERLEG